MSSPEFSAPTEHLQTPEAQQTLQAVGLAVQSLSKGRPRIDLPTEKIATEYRSSVSVTELAQRHGVSKGTIYNRLHEAGLPEHKLEPTIDLAGNIETTVKHEESSDSSLADRARVVREENANGYENEEYIKAKLQKVRAWHEELKRQGISVVDIPIEDAYKILLEIEKETSTEFGLPWPPSPASKS